MAVVTRDITIVYGSLTISPANSRFLNDYVRETINHDEAIVEFEFVSTAASDAAFASEIDTVRNEFRTRRQRLKITQGASTLLDLNPDQNTGLNADPEIVKDGDEGDTGRSRTFRIRIRFDMPSDRLGQEGRRNSREQVVYDESRIRTVIMSGEWTSLSSQDSATAQYQASIAAYVTSVRSDLSITTWEQVGEEEIDRDEDDKVLTYRLVYRELILNQASGVLDHPSIVNQSLFVEVNEEHPGDSPPQELTSIGGQAGRLLRIEIQYEASIDQDETTGLDTLWSDTIKPYLISHALTVASAGDSATVRMAPTYDGPGNRITATGTILAVGPNTRSVIEYEYTEERDTQEPVAFDPAWTGDELSYYVYAAPQITLRNVIERAQTLGGAVNAGGGGGVGRFRPGVRLGGGLRNVGRGGQRGMPGIALGPAGGAPAGGGPEEGQWILVSQRTGSTPKKRGEGSNQLDVTEDTAFRQWRLVHPIPVSSTVFTPGQEVPIFFDRER